MIFLKRLAKMLSHTIARVEAGSPGNAEYNINYINDISDRMDPDSASNMLGHTQSAATSRTLQADARRTTPSMSVSYAK